MADAKKKKVVGPVKRPDNFDELEKEFETVLNELLNDESLEKFKKQYEKLHTALVNSHESERALMDKIRDLNEEISTNAEKVSTALKLSKDDEARITSLTGELEGAWKKVEYLKQREQWSKETISALQQEIEQLNQLVQKGADLAVQFQSSEPSGYMPLGKVEGRVGTGTKDSGQPGGTDGSGGQDHLDGVEDLKMRVQELDSEKSRLQEMVNTTMTEVRQKTMELQRERTRRMNAEDLTRQLNTAQELVNSQESTLRELRVSCELSSKEIESLTGRLQKVQSEMEKQSGLVDTLQMEVNEQSNTLRLKDDKLFKLTDSVKKLTKAKEMATRKLKKLTEQRASLRHEKEQLHGQLTVATKTIDANKKTREQDQMHINGLMHERDLINKNLVKQVKATEKQANLVSLHEQTCQNMGHEIMGFHREAEKQRRIIQQLEKERDRYINENGDLNMKLMKNMEELKMRDLRILDQKKRGEELECRLKVQQNLYEAVHQDRNTYSAMGFAEMWCKRLVMRFSATDFAEMWCKRLVMRFSAADFAEMWCKRLVMRFSAADFAEMWCKRLVLRFSAMDFAEMWCKRLLVRFNAIDFAEMCCKRLVLRFSAMDFAEMWCKSRLLIECQDEMNEMKTKLRMLEHQSHQLKEEVAAREQAVVKEHMECLRLEKEKDGLVGEVQMLKNQLREVQTVVTDLRAEEKNLQKVIADSDEIIKRQKRELDAIISERDILGSQLVRRNDELSLVYQKVKLLQTLLNNGNRMYDERIEV
ncbi:cilia- and flagella-associated protein 58-like [Babylonia areolata]|uniref:cilia- and flagella-associated protein 58-like n=1 Tax=Babylonia areolata TaxID=304850 RepID=UPI003FD05292